jgi:hypothetical protein
MILAPNNNTAGQNPRPDGPRLFLNNIHPRPNPRPVKAHDSIGGSNTDDIEDIPALSPALSNSAPGNVNGGMSLGMRTPSFVEALALFVMKPPSASFGSAYLSPMTGTLRPDTITAWR